MQTFLPYKDYGESAKCLDRLRLGKQRIEGVIILENCLEITTGWKNHPVVRMWKGCEGELLKYCKAICQEYKNRGYAEGIHIRLMHIEINHKLPTTIPQWLGQEWFHKSHQSNLLRKYPQHYKKFGWNVISTLPYLWPKGVDNVKSL